MESDLDLSCDEQRPVLIQSDRVDEDGGGDVDRQLSMFDRRLLVEPNLYRTIFVVDRVDAHDLKSTERVEMKSNGDGRRLPDEPRLFVAAEDPVGQPADAS
jgi:hypothetical protein